MYIPCVEWLQEPLISDIQGGCRSMCAWSSCMQEPSTSEDSPSPPIFKCVPCAQELSILAISNSRRIIYVCIPYVWSSCRSPQFHFQEGFICPYLHVHSSCMSPQFTISKEEFYLLPLSVIDTISKGADGKWAAE